MFACLFIVVCLPRVFLEKYVAIGHPEIGFLEYKIPTLAHMFGIPVCSNHDFDPWWAKDPATANVPGYQRILNAIGQEIPFSVILHELANNKGKRLFHPVSKILPGWIENQYMVKFLSYFRIPQFTKVVSRSINKLKQRVNNLTRRFT